MDVTYNFTAGTRAVAQQVNQNFADVKSAVDVLETDVADLQAEVSGLDFVKADGSVDFTRLQSYATYTVSNATNATPIVITAVAHSFLTGDKVQISGVGGNTAANGTFTITKLGADTFSLDGSVGNGAFSSNGTAIIVPVSAGNLINKAYLDANAGALKINALGAVSTNITLDTNTVTTADVSGAITITLPTTLVSGNENTVVFDFSTTSSSSPTINQDATTVSITAASNATPIVITATAHGFNTGDKVYITGVLGNTAANGTWVITRLTADTFSLNGSVGNGTYTSGGTVRKANFKWSDKNQGKAPTSYSIISGVRNILVFKTHDGGTTWEVEYSTYGAIEQSWTQPTLTTNGTLGDANTELAVYTAASLNYATYYLFNGLSPGFMGDINSPVYFSTAKALKISSLQIRNSYTDANGAWLTGQVYGSNDGSTYILLKTFTNAVTTAGITWTIDMSDNTSHYKYHEIVVSTGNGGYKRASKVTIIGTYIASST